MTLRSTSLAILAVLAAAPALAQDGLRPSGPRLVVTGRGSADVAPDHAVVSIGVTSRGATAAAALDETSVAAAKVTAGARAAGIDPKDIRTGQVSVQPLYKGVREPSGGMRQQPDGFQAINSVSVRVRDLPRLGELLRRSVDDGASQLSGIAFGLADRAGPEREAQAAAVANARGEAEALARAAGVKLGRIQEIRSVERSGPLRPLGMEAMRAAPSAEVPVEPGRIEVSAAVEIVWAIEEP